MSSIQIVLKDQGHFEKILPFVSFKANFITRLTSQLGHKRFLVTSEGGIHIMCDRNCSLHSRIFRISSKFVTIRENFAFILDTDNNNVFRLNLLDSESITDVPYSENSNHCVVSMCGDYILGSGESGTWISKWNQDQLNFVDLQYRNPLNLGSLHTMVGLGNKKFLTVSAVDNGTVSLTVWESVGCHLYATAIEDYNNVVEPFKIIPINDTELLMCLNNQLVLMDYALGFLEQKQQRFSKYHNFQIQDIQKHNEFIVVGHKRGYQIMSMQTGLIVHQYCHPNFKFRMIPSDRFAFFEILIWQLHSYMYELQLCDFLEPNSSS